MDTAVNKALTGLVTISGIAAVIVAWALAAQRIPPYVLPGPLETWDALVAMAASNRLWEPVWLTIVRSAIGLGLAGAIGLSWGALSAASRVFDLFTGPWTSFLMAIPPIVFVVIGLLAFGPNATVVIMVVILVTLPLLTTTTRDAIHRVDADLLEMARAFNRGRVWRWRHVIIPAVIPPLLSAFTVAAGQSLRLTVMAELLATTTGMGAQIQRARNNLETDEVFALAIVLASLTLLSEMAVLSPIRRRFTTRKEASDERT